MTRSISSRHTSPRIVFAGAIACSLILVACGDPAAPTAAPATTTPGPGVNARAGFIATLIPLTEAPNRAVPVASQRAVGGSAAPSTSAGAIPTGTNLRGNATPGGTAAAGTRTWVDPVNGIQLQYPAVWRATPAMTANDDDLRLDGPSNQTIFVDISAPDADGPAPTADEALQLIRAAQARSTQYTYTYGMQQDVKVGGESAKYLEYQYTPRANQTAPAAQGAIWVIQRGDRTYVLRASNIGMGRADVDGIIASVSYSTPAAPSTTPGPPVRGTAALTAPASAMPNSGSAGSPSATVPLVRGTPSSAASRTAPAAAGSRTVTP